MTPQKPAWEDLCAAVRATRRAHLRAITATDAAQAALKSAEADQQKALAAECEARDALDSFIDAETEVDA